MPGTQLSGPRYWLHLVLDYSSCSNVSDPPFQSQFYFTFDSLFFRASYAQFFSDHYLQFNLVFTTNKFSFWSSFFTRINLFFSSFNNGSNCCTEVSPHFYRTLFESSFLTMISRAAYKRRWGGDSFTKPTKPGSCVLKQKQKLSFLMRISQHVWEGVAPLRGGVPVRILIKFEDFTDSRFLR